MKRASALTTLFAVLCVAQKATADVRPASPGPGAPPVVRGSATWIFGDDDALHGPSDARPASPAPGSGDRDGYDALAAGVDSRFTGRENELILGTTVTAPGFLRGVSTSADLALGLDLAGLGSRPAALLAEDRGSTLEITWALGPSQRAPVLALRLLPLNADRLRVGWLELLAWGGEAGPRRDSPYAGARTPPRGAALEAAAGAFHVELGLKTATFLEPVQGGPAVEEVSYGAYGVLQVRSGPFSAGVGLGRFEHGRLSALRSPPRAVTMGASLRASVGVGLKAPRAPFGLGLEPSGVIVDTGQAGGWAVGVEAVTLVERLRSFERPVRSTLSPARAVALAGTLVLGAVEVRALVALRELGFVMRSVPGVFEGLTVPREAAAQGDALGLVSTSVRVRPWLEPGLSLGARSPAAVMTASLDALGQPTGATVVAYAPGDVELLPAGERPVPIVEACASLALRWSSLLETVGFVGYRRDFNRARLERASGGSIARAFADPNRLFYGLAARAVW